MNNPIKAFCLIALASTGILAITSALFCCSGYFNWQWNWNIRGRVCLMAYIGLTAVYILALKHQVTKGAAAFGAVGWGLIALTAIFFSESSTRIICNWITFVGYVLVAISFIRMPRNLHVGAKVGGLIGAGYNALLEIAWLIFGIAVAQGDGSSPEQFFRIIFQFSNIPGVVADILLIVPFAVMMISNGLTYTTSWSSSFRGRARRKEYWTKTVSVIGFSLVLYVPSFLILMAKMAEQMAYSPKFYMPGNVLTCAVLGGVLVVAVFLLLLPVTVRRLHDRDMSGWWVLWFWLLSSIPFVGWIVPIVQFVIIGCLEGTVGPNQFGADPKEKEHTALLRGLNVAQASNDTVSHGAQPDSGTQSETSVRLKKLQELRAQGLISAVEYEEKRSKVLETI